MYIEILLDTVANMSPLLLGINGVKKLKNGKILLELYNEMAGFRLTLKRKTICKILRSWNIFKHCTTLYFLYIFLCFHL